MQTTIFKVEIYGEGDVDQEFFSREKDAMYIYKCKREQLKYYYEIKEIIKDTEYMLDYIDKEGNERYALIDPVILNNDLEN